MTLVTKHKTTHSLLARAMTKWSAVNCWHLGEHESAAMWDLYMRAGAGVAIRSTFDRLKTSLEGAEANIFLGEVKYIDYTEDAIPLGNAFAPAMHKRKSFAYESEVRAFINEAALGADGTPDFDASLWDVGVEVDVDLETLIERVHVGPTAPSWFASLVASVTARYGFGWEVSQSLLLENPLF